MNAVDSQPVGRLDVIVTYSPLFRFPDVFVARTIATILRYIVGMLLNCYWLERRYLLFTRPRLKSYVGC
jgi:hypothetical protein